MKDQQRWYEYQRAQEPYGVDEGEQQLSLSVQEFPITEEGMHEEAPLQEIKKTRTTMRSEQEIEDEYTGSGILGSILQRFIR